MQIIEGAIPAWYPGQISRGVEWDQMPVFHPDKAPADSLPVLVIPVPLGSLDEVKRKIALALG